MTRVLLGLIIALSISPLAGCGGPGGPKPLSYHFDPADIALVPMAEKETVLRAQNDYQRARALYLKTQAELEEVKTKLEVAKNERKAARLAEKSAQQKQKRAEQSNDLNRINSTKAGMHAATLQRRAADHKVDYLKQQIKFLKKWERYSEENMYAQEARYEESMAHLAQQKSIRPKGFEYAHFKKQKEDRSKRAQEAKVRADRVKKQVDELRKTWLATRKEAQKAGAAVTALPDDSSVTTDTFTPTPPPSTPASSGTEEGDTATDSNAGDQPPKKDVKKESTESSGGAKSESENKDEDKSKDENKDEDASKPESDSSDE